MKIVPKDIFISVSLVICIVFAIVIYIKLESSSACEEIVINKSCDNGIKVTVEIAGAVEKPGVYELKNGSTVEDLLKISGNISKEANKQFLSESVNRARKLQDGEKIYIPNLIEREEENLKTILKEKANYKINSSLININTATEEGLTSLDGIGSTYAKRIVEGRPYKRKEDIKQIKGIGDSTYNKIKDKITL